MAKTGLADEREEGSTPGSGSALIPAHVTADFANRIAVPKPFSDHPPFEGTESFQAWLFLLAQGRYRLLSEDQVKADPQLESVRTLLLEGRPAASKEATHSEDLASAAIVARLLPASVTPPPPRWRISFPKGFDPFVPPECDPKAFSVLFSPEGYLELWYTDVLRKAVFLSLEAG